MSSPSAKTSSKSEIKATGKGIISTVGMPFVRLEPIITNAGIKPKMQHNITIRSKSTPAWKEFDKLRGSSDYKERLDRICIISENGKLLAVQYDTGCSLEIIDLRPHEVDTAIDHIRSSYSRVGNSRISNEIFYGLIDLKRAKAMASHYPELEKMELKHRVALMDDLKKARIYFHDDFYNYYIASKNDLAESIINQKVVSATYTSIIKIYAGLKLKGVLMKEETENLALIKLVPKDEYLLKKDKLERTLKRKMNIARESNDETSFEKYELQLKQNKSDIFEYRQRLLAQKNK